VASLSQAPPAAAPSSAFDQAGRWFWDFLKTELSPYPGRASVVARITIAATIVMLVVMTFDIPSGFLAAIFTVFLSRENPTATLRAGVRAVIAFTLATAYTLLGIMTLVDDPLTHFVWIVGTLFICFYLIRIIHDYGSAVAFGFLIAGAIPLWDETTLNVNTRVENTLWLAFSVILGSGVTIAVEYVFRRVQPETDLTLGIESRLQAVENLLRNLAGDPAADKSPEKVTFFSNTGTSRLRRLMVRSGYSPHFIAQMTAAVALLGRLVDLAASLQLFRSKQPTAIAEADRVRCQHLADEISTLRKNLLEHRPPEMIDISLQGAPSNLVFLASMESTVALMPQAFVGSKSIHEYVVAPMDDEVDDHLLVHDAFSNPAHILFALRGTLAATACYVVYTSIDWTGLSTSVVTCIITALSTIGSSRQKQFLRLAGAIIGGIIFGMGAQIFVLPHVDSIVGFTVLFMLVTAISGWISTATSRLSYLGVQLALAYYLVHLQEFAIQTSLGIARDRIFGVLLGLLSMWIFFDRLWVKDALDEMEAVFAKNLQMLAELADQLLKDDRVEAVKKVRLLRDQINAGFLAVSAQSDAILFEFGPSRERKLKIRDDVRRWQPSLRTLLLVQLTTSQYRLQKPIKELPDSIAQSYTVFEKDVACVMRVMADDVSGNNSESAPDIQMSAVDLQKEIRKYYEERELQIPAQATDMISLTGNLASILSPLYQDIHATFSSPREDTGGLHRETQTAV
jgi:multidrug resistance protein MdtO